MTAAVYWKRPGGKLLAFQYGPDHPDHSDWHPSDLVSTSLTSPLLGLPRSAKGWNGLAWLQERPSPCSLVDRIIPVMAHEADCGLVLGTDTEHPIKLQTDL